MSLASYLQNDLNPGMDGPATDLRRRLVADPNWTQMSAEIRLLLDKLKQLKQQLLDFNTHILDLEVAVSGQLNQKPNPQVDRLDNCRQNGQNFDQVIKQQNLEIFQLKLQASRQQDAIDQLTLVAQSQLTRDLQPLLRQLSGTGIQTLTWLQSRDCFVGSIYAECYGVGLVTLPEFAVSIAPADKQGIADPVQDLELNRCIYQMVLSYCYAWLALVAEPNDFGARWVQISLSRRGISAKFTNQAKLWQLR